MKRNGMVAYEASDYLGCYNLKQAEKDLILLAAKLTGGDRVVMARCMKITYRTLVNKLFCHKLIDVL